MPNEIIIDRQELYEQVWQRPVRQVALEYGISDVGLAKVCERLEVPRPPRGYWAKQQHGKKRQHKQHVENVRAERRLDRLLDNGRQSSHRTTPKLNANSIAAHQKAGHRFFQSLRHFSKMLHISVRGKDYRQWTMAHGPRKTRTAKALVFLKID